MRVALADDSALFREGLSLLLGSAGVEVVAQAANGDELLALVRRQAPDVAIVDIRMPPTFTDEGLVTAGLLREHHPAVGVLVLSTYAETSYAVTLLNTGQDRVGYLLKDGVSDVRNLVDALTRISAGETVVDPVIVRRLVARQETSGLLEMLTPRERSVLELMAEGRSNAGIGRALSVGTKTVERHIASIFDSLGIHGSADDNRRVLAVLSWMRTYHPETPAPH